MSHLPHKAFLSYSHADNDHDGDKIRQFILKLAGEVGVLIGERFEIFIDSPGIATGQKWQKRLDEAVDGASIFIPILTPSYFRSEPCKKEFDRFRKREKSLKRDDLIFPIYYVQSDEIQNKEKLAANPRAQELMKRQYEDWRGYRHEQLTSSDVARAITQIAEHIKKALEREPALTPAAKKTAAKKTATKRNSSQAGESAQESAASEQRLERAMTIGTNESAAPPLRTEPKEWIVSALPGGHFKTIKEALEIALDGHRILIRRGTYRESLVITKVLELIGDGNRDDIVIEVEGTHAIHSTAIMGLISNLTIRQTGGGNYDAVSITQGRLDLEECQITGEGRAGIGVTGKGTDPRLRDNQIPGSRFGVIFSQGAKGLMEKNDVSNCEQAGIAIGDGANPTIRDNQIHDGNESGIFVYKGGLGFIEKNNILGNTHAGISILEAGNPNVRENRIERNLWQGIFVHDEGGGTFESNTLSDNAKGPWLIAPDCKAKVTTRGNTPEPG